MRLRDRWNDLRIESVNAEVPPEVVVGQAVPVTADIFLGTLPPDDVSVELYYGLVSANGQITEPQSVPMHRRAETATAIIATRATFRAG